jgi:hypothetical protein
VASGATGFILTDFNLRASQPMGDREAALGRTWWPWRCQPPSRRLRAYSSGLWNLGTPSWNPAVQVDMSRVITCVIWIGNNPIRGESLFEIRCLLSLWIHLNPSCSNSIGRPLSSQLIGFQPWSLSLREPSSHRSEIRTVLGGRKHPRSKTNRCARRDLKTPSDPLNQSFTKIVFKHNWLITITSKSSTLISGRLENHARNIFFIHLQFTKTIQGPFLTYSINIKTISLNCLFGRYCPHKPGQ